MNVTFGEKYLKDAENRQPGAQPQRFLMWLSVVASSMLFAGLTSAYIVKKGSGDWKLFQIPTVFIINTIIILLSSTTLYWAYLAAKKDNLLQTKLALFTTSLLGITFLTGQWIGYQHLIASGIVLSGGNASEGFFYIITGLHGLHIVGALIALTVMIIKTILLKVNSQNLLGLEMVSIFWHSLGILWLYLYLFLQFN